MTSHIELLIDDKKRQSRRGSIKVKRGVRQLYPGNIQRQYQKALNAMVSRLIDLTRQNIYPELPLIVEQAQFNRPNTDGLIDKIKKIFTSMDDFSDQIAEAIDKTRVGFDQEHTEDEMVRLTEIIALQISAFNRKQVTKVIKRMVGVDVFFDEPWLNQEISAFVKSNVDLIKTIPDRYFADIEEIIYRGARQGIRHEEIRKELITRYGKTRNIAKRIARDQVNKFNGQLTKLRQESIGIKEYTWITVGDERVRGRPGGRYPDARPSHWDRDGNIYKWDDPPSGGHPGEPIQCRCWAEPVLEDFI